MTIFIFPGIKYLTSITGYGNVEINAVVLGYNPIGVINTVALYVWFSRKTFTQYRE